MFRGRFSCKIDEKGRLSLPSSIAQQIKQAADLDVIVTNNQFQGKSSLDLYPIKTWENLEKQIAKLPSMRPEVQFYRRFYLSGGQLLQIDKQKRICIPQSLREYAKLESEVMLVAMGDKVEIWNAKTWRELHDKMAADFETSLEKLSQIKEISL